jgi:hypothetical protein
MTDRIEKPSNAHIARLAWRSRRICRKAHADLAAEIDPA